MNRLPSILFAMLLFVVQSAGAVEITQPPESVTVWLGQPATLSVQATGVPPVSIQWHRNGLPIAGATGESLTITSVSESNAGVYFVSVTDGAGGMKGALARVSLPGAVMQWSGSIFAQGAADAGGAIPVALSQGDPTFAITSMGALLWTDDGSDYGRWPLATLEPPPADSQPADLGPVVEIAAHGHRIVALQADGVVRAWTRSRLDASPAPLGTWSHTLIALPADAQRGRSVFIDGECVFVVRWDGTVAVVGPPTDPLANVPAGLANVAVITSGKFVVWHWPDPEEVVSHAVALRADGAVVAWGDNTSGQTEVPAGLTNVVQVAAGWGWSLALKSDGSVVQWGAQGSSVGGPLGSPPPPTPPPAGVFRSIRAGASMALAITTAGQPVSWSPNGFTFLGGSSDYLDPLPPVIGDVLDLGNRWSGSTSRGFMSALCRAAGPVIVHQPENTAAFAGDTVFLSVEATGRPLPSYQWFKDTAEIVGATTAELKIISFSSTDAASYTVKASNLHGEVTSAPAVLTLASGPEISSQPQNVALHPGASATLGITATGSGTLSYRWFKNGRVIPGAASSSLAIASGLPADAGVYQAEITDANGSRRSRLVRVGEGCSPVGWHDGASVNYLGAVQGSPHEVFLALSEGEGWLGIGADGKLGWFYERVNFGNSATYAPDPMSFPTASGSLNVVSVAARARFGVVVDRDGMVSAWESRTSMVCYTPQAIGNYTASCWPSANNRPLAVPAVAHGAIAISISAGEEALALRSDGKVIGWNARWSTLTSVPASVNGGVTAISSGKDHHLALKEDGTVIAWGDNSEGECVVPASLANVAGIAALENVSFAILDDGSVVAWGDNSMGQTNVPAGLSGAASISGARGTVLATKGDGTLAVWGAGAASSLPASLSNVRAAAVMPVDPPPPGVITLSGNINFSSYGVALVPVAPPVVTVWSYIQRVFPGYSGNIAYAYASSFPSGPLTGVWQKNGAPLASTATTRNSSTLSLSNVTAADAGEYRMAYDNGWQTGVSNAVQLEVVQPRLFSDWQAANFTSAEHAAGLDAPDADPGGYGITNLMRYALGLDAHSPSAALLPQPTYVPAVPGVVISPFVSTIGTSESIRLSFEVPQDTADLRYFFESSADLLTWNRSYNPPDMGTSSNGRRQVSFTGYSGSPYFLGGLNSPPQRFFRMGVEQSTPVKAPQF